MKLLLGPSHPFPRSSLYFTCISASNYSVTLCLPLAYPHSPYKPHKPHKPLPKVSSRVTEFVIVSYLDWWVQGNNESKIESETQLQGVIAIGVARDEPNQELLDLWVEIEDTVRNSWDKGANVTWSG